LNNGLNSSIYLKNFKVTFSDIGQRYIKEVDFKNDQLWKNISSSPLTVSLSNFKEVLADTQNNNFVLTFSRSDITLGVVTATFAVSTGTCTITYPATTPTWSALSPTPTQPAANCSAYATNSSFNYYWNGANSLTQQFWTSDNSLPTRVLSSVDIAWSGSALLTSVSLSGDNRSRVPWTGSVASPAKVILSPDYGTFNGNSSYQTMYFYFSQDISSTHPITYLKFNFADGCYLYLGTAP
jgi:hypothetical protein